MTRAMRERNAWSRAGAALIQLRHALGRRHQPGGRARTRQAIRRYRQALAWLDTFKERNP